MKLKKTVWGYDPKYYRLEPLDDAEETLGYVYFEEKEPNANSATGPPLKDQPSKTSDTLLMKVWKMVTG